MFESLWIDKPNAPEVLNRLSFDPTNADVLEHLRHFHEFGYCIISGAVAPEVIDSYLGDFSTLINEDKILISYGHDIRNAKREDLQRPLTKVLDTYVFSDNAQSMAFCSPVRKFLNLLFQEPPLAFQNLHFEMGSTQAVHNDTAYVVVNEAKSLAASWVALEDVQPGSGELIYYPGSHRFGDFLYQNYRKSWSPSEDGHEIHDHHLQWLHHRARELGIGLQRFLPKKGDVLLWHADLAHGGGEITREGSTRRSLVTHYCPARCTPHYFRYLDIDRQTKREVDNKCYISSFYYRV